MDLEPLLAIQDLHAEYRTGRSVAHALNGVTLSILPGEAFGLVGETGAGKTTTALCTMRLMPRDVGRITQGTIQFNGETILDMTQAKKTLLGKTKAPGLSEKRLTDLRGKEIAMIFQNPLTSLNPVYTIKDQIGLVFNAHEHLSKKETRDRVAESLKTVGILPERMDDYPHQFSGGMRQRVGIAAAMALNPKLLIADEPTTALDVTIQAQILELMKKLQHQNASSLLMITHNLGIIAELCQRVAVMYAGTIVEMGNVKDVFTSPAHPYTVGLLGAIPSLTTKTERLSYIPGNVVNSSMIPSGCPFHPRCAHCTEQCRQEQPPVTALSAGHYAACWKGGHIDG